MTRIAIAGGPRTGKTRLAAQLAAPGVVVGHTDDLIATHDWSAASAEAATWFDRPGPFVIEGVAVSRALRKWLSAHSEGKPCDVLYWGEQPMEELSRGQASMAKGCAKVHLEIVGELRSRGVRVELFPAATGTRVVLQDAEADTNRGASDG